MSEESSGAKTKKPRIHYGFVITGAIFCLLGLIYGIRMAYGVFFTPMSQDMGWSAAITSLAYSVSMLVEGATNILMGYVCDKYGPRRVVIISVIIICIGYCLVPLVTAAWHFILLFGLVVGFGMGGLFVPLLSVLTRWFAKRTTLVLGIAMSGIGIGTLIISPLSNYMINTFEWKNTYFIMGITILIVGIGMSFFLKRDPASMGLLPYGATENETKVPVKTSYGFSVKEAVKTPQLWITFFGFMCAGFVLLAVHVHIVPDMLHTGIDSATAATIFSIVGFSQILGRVGLAAFADKLGNKNIIALCFIAYLIIVYWFTSLAAVWAFIILAVVFGTIHGGMTTSQSPIIAKLFGLKNHGMLFGICGFGFTIGAALGPFTSGLIFDNTGSYQTAFLVSTIVAAAGLVLTIALRPIKNPNLPVTRL